MRKKFILAFMVYALSSQLVFSQQADDSGQKQKTEDFNKRYFEKCIRSFRNNVEVSLSYYDVLLELDRESLSESSGILLDDILAILKSPEEESLRTKYLDDFPKTFSEFLEIFHPSNFKELYSGSYVFLEMFEDILKERPRETAKLLIGLSVDAQYDADAPSHLRGILANFISNYYDFLIGPFNKLAHAHQQNIITYICDVENFAAYHVFNSIIRKLEEKNNKELLKRFLAAKEERISIGPHGENVVKSELIIEPYGVAGIVIGDSAASVNYKYYRQAVLVDLDNEGTLSPALNIQPEETSREDAIVAELTCNGELVVWRICVYDPAFRTRSGIGVGSTFGQLRKLHNISGIGMAEGIFCFYVDDLSMGMGLDISGHETEAYGWHLPSDIPDNIKILYVLLTKKKESQE